MDGVAIKAMVSELAPVVREYVEAAAAPLRDRIAALEEEKGALAARCSSLEDAAQKRVEIDLRDVEKLIAAEIAKLPAPEPVKEIDREELAEAITLAVGEAVAALPPPEKGEDGKNIDPGAVEEMVENAVSKAVAELPPPKDGNDGRGVKDLLIDRDGNLVATMDDGEMKSLGPVIGKDGDPGKDGRDGIDLTSFEAIVLDDDRTIELKFISGEEERVASFKWPAPIYRGVFKEGVEYAQGDVVTWAGSQWHCDEPTSDKPGTEKWTLSCKKGRDGKDAARG
jgi:hypothetical protein